MLVIAAEILETLHDASGYPRTTMKIEILCLLVPESRGKFYKVMLVCTYKVQLPWCFKQRHLVAAKQVHDCIIKSRMEQNMLVANNLLSVYIRCGRLQDACRAFDELVQKNVYSWTIMIGGYAQHSHAKDAMEIFNQMRQEGAQPNEITYLSILKACASPLALEWGKEVHVHIRHDELESDVRVGTAFLKMLCQVWEHQGGKASF